MTGVNAGVLTPFATYVAGDTERALVRLIGELDVAAVPRAELAIAEAEGLRPALLELDLSALAFLDSSGLRLMLKTRERALQARRRLLLRRGPDAVQRIFEITALVPLFEFVD